MREDMETYDLQLIKLPHDVLCPRPAAYLMVSVLCFEGRNIDNLHTDTTPRTSVYFDARNLGFLGIVFVY